MEFQVRVSSECLYYLSLLEELYSKDTDGSLTKGIVLTRAFEESKAVKNWLDIYEDKHSIPLNTLEYSHGSNQLRESDLIRSFHFRFIFSK